MGRFFILFNSLKQAIKYRQPYQALYKEEGE